MQLATLGRRNHRNRRAGDALRFPGKRTPSRTDQRLPADRAGGVQLQPRIDAPEVEVVVAPRQQPQHVAVPVLRQADRAAALARLPPRELRVRVEELRVAEDRGLAEPGAGLVAVAVVVVVLLLLRGGGAVAGVGREAPAAAPAGQGVGDDGGEEDQEGEPERGDDAIGERRRRRRRG